MKEISETARKLIRKLLDINNEEGFVLLAMLLLNTEEMKSDAQAFLDEYPQCTMGVFLMRQFKSKLEGKQKIVVYKRAMVEYRHCVMMGPSVYKRDDKIFRWSYRKNSWQELLTIDWEEGLFNDKSMIAKWTMRLTQEEAMAIITKYADIVAKRMLWMQQKDKVQENINAFIRHRELDDRLLDMLLVEDNDLFAIVSNVLGRIARVKKKIAEVNYYQYSIDAPCIFDEEVLFHNCKTILENKCYESLVPVVVNLIVQYKIVRTVGGSNEKLYEDIVKKVYEIQTRPEVSVILSRWSKYAITDCTK